MNYYQVHKNKRSKKSIKRKTYYKGLRALKAAVILSKHRLDIEIVKHSFNNIALKAIKTSLIILKTQKDISNLFSKKQKYIDRLKQKTRNC